MRWRAKAKIQRSLGLLPRGHDVNYLLQRYVSRSLECQPTWFDYKLGQAAHHWEIWRELRGSTPPAAVMELGTGWFPVIVLCLALAGCDEVASVDKVGLSRPRELALAVQVCAEALAQGRLHDTFGAIDESRAARLLRLAKADAVFWSDLVGLGIEAVVADVSVEGWRDRPFDFFISNNTLEHIPENSLGEIFLQMNNLATENAVLSHFIDMTDHYWYDDPGIGPLHFLRYTNNQWRRRWDNKIVPQNRLRISDYRRLLEEAGLNLEREDHEWVVTSDEIESLDLAAEFRAYSHADLKVRGAWFTMTPTMRRTKDS